MLHLFIVSILILATNFATPGRENWSYQALTFTCYCWRAHTLHNNNITGKLKRCEKCGDSSKWLLLCLDCGSFGCYGNGHGLYNSHGLSNSHVFSHFNVTNHKIYMELNCGKLICAYIKVCVHYTMYSMS